MENLKWKCPQQGHDKQNISVEFCASSAGNKKLPFIIFKGKGDTLENIDEMACLNEGKSLCESKPALQYLMSLKPDEID